MDLKKCYEMLSVAIEELTKLREKILKDTFTDEDLIVLTEANKKFNKAMRCINKHHKETGKLK